MRVAKGIAGIRNYRAENRSNWQIFLDGKYDGFSELSLNEIISSYDGSWILESIQGNILSITTSL